MKRLSPQLILLPLCALLLGADDLEKDGQYLLTILAAIGFFALAMVMLGIGLLFHRRGLRGSCKHAPPLNDSDGERLICPGCETECKPDCKEE